MMSYIYNLCMSIINQLIYTNNDNIDNIVHDKTLIWLYDIVQYENTYDYIYWTYEIEEIEEHIEADIFSLIVLISDDYLKLKKN